MGCDQDIDAGEKIKWTKWFMELLEPCQARFPRSMRPPQAEGQPRLAGFCAAAEEALCAVLYVVWAVKDGAPTSRLLLAKCRVSPLFGATIPQGELQLLVVLHCLALVVAESFPTKFSSISMYMDSMCSLGALNKETGIL